jgi:dihydrofolate synthase/folylpolyglutamate synthase
VTSLERIYLAQGYRVGAFTSPQLWQINEEIRINGQNVSDTALVNAFSLIEATRAEVSLTLFEYTTLAALLLFQQAQVDVMVLEVGLGGRLDAVNIVDSDVAIVTSIGIDHQAYLGDSREKIALEKAGIMRQGRLAICGDCDPPYTLIEYAKTLEASLKLIQRDFDIIKQQDSWTWQGGETKRDLSLPDIELSNAACALAAIEALQKRLPVSDKAIKQGLKNLRLPGRYQVVDQPVMQIFDVAHNPQAAALLANRLRQTQRQYTKTNAVFSMLSGKDVQATIGLLKDLIDTWHIAELDTPRRASIAWLREAFVHQGIENVKVYDNIALAHQAALDQANADERLVVFGSFYTVAATLNPKVCS